MKHPEGCNHCAAVRRPRPDVRRPPEERFAEKCAPQPNGCILWTGTIADNVADMVAKGRVARGEGRKRNADGQWLPRELVVA